MPFAQAVQMRAVQMPSTHAVPQQMQPAMPINDLPLNPLQAVDSQVYVDMAPFEQTASGSYVAHGGGLLNPRSQSQAASNATPDIEMLSVVPVVFGGEQIAQQIDAAHAFIGVHMPNSSIRHDRSRSDTPSMSDEDEIPMPMPL